MFEPKQKVWFTLDYEPYGDDITPHFRAGDAVVISAVTTVGTVRIVQDPTDGEWSHAWFSAYPPKVVATIDPAKPELTVGGILFTAPETKVTSASGGAKGTKPLRYDLIPPEALAEVAYIYAIGAAKYGEHNFEKGLPYSSNIAALQRHLEKFKLGHDWDDESEGDRKTHHLAAVAFHVFALLFYQANGVGVDDRKS